MERRNLLKTVGVVGTGAVASGAGILALTGGASASFNQDYSEVTATTDDGELQHVSIYGQSTVTWDGFDDPATQFKIINEAQVGDSEYVELNDTGMVQLSNDDWGDNESLSGEGTSGTIETSIGVKPNGTHNPANDWVILGDDPESDYDLPVNSIPISEAPVTTEDGETNSFTIEISNTYRWYDSNGGLIFSKTFNSSLPVSVTNEKAQATGESTNSGAVAE